MGGLVPVYEFRPLPDAFRQGWPVLRYADGAWLEDDGEYDIAFLSHNVCLYVEVPYQRNIVWSWTSDHWSANEPRHPRGNAWHYMLRDGETEWGGDWGRSLHQNTKAGDSGMNHACSKWRSASGRHVEFNLKDPHIAAGLLRERETGQIVTPPDKPICMYCGEAWRAKHEIQS